MKKKPSIKYQLASVKKTFSKNITIALRLNVI